MIYQPPQTVDLETATLVCCPSPVLELATKTLALQSGVLDQEWAHWSEFLDSLILPGGPIGADHVGAVRKVWTHLWDKLGFRLRIPMTQITSEGAIQVSWDSGREYLDIDIYPDGSLAWFHRDRTAGTAEGTEEETLRSLPDPLVAKLDAMLA